VLLSTVTIRVSQAVRDSVLSPISTFIGRNREKRPAWQGNPVGAMRQLTASDRPKGLNLDKFLKGLPELFIAQGDGEIWACFSKRACLSA
jgi:hypothetical protein